MRIVMRARKQPSGIQAEQVREEKALSHAPLLTDFENLDVPRPLKRALLDSQCQQGEQALFSVTVKGTGDTMDAVTGVVVTWVKATTPRSLIFWTLA
jgi:hypothetical protein